MQILFIADPLDSFSIRKDTTFAMMREAQRRGHELFFSQVEELQWTAGGVVQVGRCQSISLTGNTTDWYRIDHAFEDREVRAFDAVLMRKDPPFDSEYFYATHLLGQAVREGAKVFNRPDALRNHPEKLSIMEFPSLIGPTIVTRKESAIRAFHAEHQDIILKPLDGMGGAGIFRVKGDGLNLGSIIETLNCFGACSVMVQKFIPAIEQGDKRILIIGGEVVPYSLARIPQGGEVRGNLAAGGKGIAQELSTTDRKIAVQLAPVLFSRGLLLVGVDVIGDKVTEINVTSPTCFQEITDQTGFDVAARFIDALEASAAFV